MIEALVVLLVPSVKFQGVSMYVLIFLFTAEVPGKPAVISV